MRSATWIGGLGLCALVACSSDERIFVSLPDGPPFAAMVVALSRGREIHVLAAPGTTDEPLELSADPDWVETLNLEILLYDVPLEAMGLVEGEISPSEGPPPLRGVPASDRLFATQIDHSAGDWVASSRMSEALANFRFSGVDEADPCTQFLFEELIIDSTSTVRTMLAPALSALYVLTATSAQSASRAFRVTREGFAPIAFEIDGASSPKLAVQTVTTGRPGRYFGSMSDGRIIELVATPERILGTTVGNIPLPHDLRRWLGVETSGTELEFFAITSTGAVFHQQGGITSTIFQFTGDPTLSAGLAVLGPDEIVAVHRYTPELLHYRRGVASLERAPLTVLDRPVSIARLPTAGLLVGTDDGRIVRGAGGDSWSALEPSEALTGISVRDFASDVAGFAFVAAYLDVAIVGRYIEATNELCLIPLEGPAFGPPQIESVGGSLVVLYSLEGSGTRVLWLHPAGRLDLGR